MITILPLKDEEKQAQILSTVPNVANNSVILVMSDSTEELGYVVIDIKASVVRMLTMKIAGYDNFNNITPDIRMCADSMMRAAASYGVNNGAYKIESHIVQLNILFASAGFSVDGDVACSDLSNIVKICKSDKDC